MSDQRTMTNLMNNTEKDPQAKTGRVATDGGF